MERFAPRLAVLLALAACAPEPPAEPPLPLPPPPPQVRPVRPAPTPPRPPAAEATHGAAARSEAAPADRSASPGEGAPAAPGPVWRVRRDGTVGCADAEALRLLRRRAEVPPRLLAEARAAGGCRTTFRVNEWTLAGQEADLLRLRLLNGGALTLWFAREDLEPPP